MIPLEHHYYPVPGTLADLTDHDRLWEARNPQVKEEARKIVRLTPWYGKALGAYLYQRFSSRSEDIPLPLMAGYAYGGDIPVVQHDKYSSKTSAEVARDYLTAHDTTGAVAIVPPEADLEQSIGQDVGPTEGAHEVEVFVKPETLPDKPDFEVAVPHALANPTDPTRLSVHMTTTPKTAYHGTPVEQAITELVPEHLDFGGPSDCKAVFLTRRRDIAEVYTQERGDNPEFIADPSDFADHWTGLDSEWDDPLGGSVLEVRLPVRQIPEVTYVGKQAVSHDDITSAACELVKEHPAAFLAFDGALDGEPELMVFDTEAFPLKVAGQYGWEPTGADGSWSQSGWGTLIQGKETPRSDSQQRDLDTLHQDRFRRTLEIAELRRSDKYKRTAPTIAPRREGHLPPPGTVTFIPTKAGSRAPHGGARVKPSPIASQTPAPTIVPTLGPTSKLSDKYRRTAALHTTGRHRRRRRKVVDGLKTPSRAHPYLSRREKRRR